MSTSAIILAGGRGSRMGGRDKGWLPYQGRPLIAHALDAIRPQVDAIVISCNRNLERYRQLGYPVVTDTESAYLGPLAGIAAAAPLCRSKWVQLCPCDAPDLPKNLTRRLLSALQETGAEAAIPRQGERLHYLCSLLAKPGLNKTPPLLAQRRLAVRGWLGMLQTVEVEFDAVENTFVNINAPEQLE